MYISICNFIKNRGDLKFLSSGEEAPRQLTVGVASVLWQMARIDGAFDRREFQEIIFSLDRSLDLLDGEAAGLLEIARVLDAKPDRLAALIAALCSYYSADQRTVIYTLACRVAESDGLVHEAEDRFRQILAQTLGVVPPEPKI